MYKRQTVDYLGESREPTETVDIFYDRADISVQYSTIGRAEGFGGTGYEAIREKLLKKAMKKGANAIIILDLERTHDQGVVYAFNPVNNRYRNRTSSDKSRIKALFIKYE